MESTAEENAREAFVFRGSGKEYFRIWIVNIALTILTLGIYSAWAKVRTNRYLYANTYIYGANFEYNAEPKRILIGRIIVVGLYGAFLLFSQYLMMEGVAGAIALVALVAMPWLVRQAVSFKLRNTSYRNIPFRYVGRSRDFYRFFILHGLLNLLTIGLAFPYSYVKFKELIINHAQYGQGKFLFRGSVKESYFTFMKVFLLSMLYAGLFGLLLFGLLMMVGAIFAGDGMSAVDLNNSLGGVSLLAEGNSTVMVSPTEAPDAKAAVAIQLLISMVLLFLFYLPMFFWYKGFSDGYFSNFVRNHTTLHDAPFRGVMRPFRLGMIALSNLIMIILSLGLLYPWAKIRYLRYKLTHTEFACLDPNQFNSLGYEVGSTVGEEMMDFFDIDIGL